MYDEFDEKTMDEEKREALSGFERGGFTVVEWGGTCVG